MPTYAITPKGIKRYQRIVPIVETGRESFTTFNEHLILDRLVKDGHSDFYFPAATSHANALNKLLSMGYVEPVADTFEDEEDPILYNTDEYGGRFPQQGPYSMGRGT